MRGVRILKIAGWVAVGLAAAAAMALVLGLVVQALWNWLMPELFGLPRLTYLQAVALLMLCHLLFKSHGGHQGASGAGHVGVPLRERVRRAVRSQCEGGDRVAAAGEPTVAPVRQPPAEARG